MKSTGPTISVLSIGEDSGIWRAVEQKDPSVSDLAVNTVGSVERGRALVKEEDFAVVLLDLDVPDMDGLSFLKELNEQTSPPRVIVMSGAACFERAVQAFRLGAHDYIVKPAELEHLGTRIREVARGCRLKRKVARLQSLPTDCEPATPVGKCAKFRRVLEQARMAARREIPILLLGETGSGKEVLAHYIHRNSPRRDGNFVPVNCAAIPDNLMESELLGHEAGAFTGAVKRRQGFFEMAEGGTIFLDEIGEMDPAFQSKLLRVVETGSFFRVGGTRPIKVDVRIISATNRDLLTEVNEGRFRADLYYRLHGFDVRIPPLRERREDIPLLVEGYLSARREGRVHVTPEALDCLAKAPWPGNIRELHHVLEKAIIMAQEGPIEPRHLPIQITKPVSPLEFPSPDRHEGNGLPLFSGTPSVRESLADVERWHITRVLDHVNGHREKAAGILGISIRTLYRKLKDYALPEHRRWS